MTVFGMKLVSPSNATLSYILLGNMIVFMLSSSLCARGILQYHDLAFLCGGFLTGSLCGAVGITFDKYGVKALGFIMLLSVTMAFTLQWLAQMSKFFIH